MTGQDKPAGWPLSAQPTNDRAAVLRARYLGQSPAIAGVALDADHLFVMQLSWGTWVGGVDTIEVSDFEGADDAQAYLLYVVVPSFLLWPTGEVDSESMAGADLLALAEADEALSTSAVTELLETLWRGIHDAAIAERQLAHVQAQLTELFGFGDGEVRWGGHVELDAWGRFDELLRAGPLADRLVDYADDGEEGGQELLELVTSKRLDSGNPEHLELASVFLTSASRVG